MHEQSLTISHAKALLREICPPRKGCRAAPWLLGGGLPPVSSAELLSCLSLSGGLLAQAAGLAWTNYSSDEWICLPSPSLPCGWHDRSPSAVTGPPATESRGALGFVLVMCAWGVVYGWPVRVRALEAVALAWLLEPNPQRLLRFLSHSPFLPTFFHFAVCLATAQIAFASTSPFSPSPTPLNRLISGILVRLDILPTSNSRSALVCKQ
jgi:hypothetical protein